MKRELKVKRIKAAILLLACIVFVTFMVLYKNAVSKPLKSNDNIVSIKVNEGDGFYDVLNRLDKEGKLSNKLFIKIKLSMNKKNITLKEGIYEIDSDVTLDEFIEKIQDDANNVNMIKVTVPEGYSIEEIAELMETSELCSKDDFLSAVKNYQLPDYIEVNDKRRYNLEGFLYPDTYLIEKGTSADNIIDKMLERFNKVIDEVEKETGTTIKNEDIYKLITIASMIEKEASVDIDRPLISSVIYNRLDKGMKLQLDATVLYALGEHVDVVLYKHLETDSPYNTYKYSGLPIGPIASPGIESIKAALLPSDTNYLYYILEKDGAHYFTDSYDDFLDKKKELGY
ncbi:MAG: endolytic transglycosylase MltG [Clostridium sp.]